MYKEKYFQNQYIRGLVGPNDPDAQTRFSSLNKTPKIFLVLLPANYPGLGDVDFLLG